MEWFYAKNNQQIGPVTYEVLAGMLQRGEVQPPDLVWHDGMPTWIPASSAPELAPIFGAAAPMGYYNPMAAAAAMGQPVYAGFWLRFVALIIDQLLLMVANFILFFVIGLALGVSGGNANTPALQGLNFFVSIGGSWLYYALMESSSYQATLGKMALGLAVTDMNGQRIGFGQATGRYFGKIISGLILCIGYMMAGWTERKQALHDIMANTLVIRRR